MRRLGACALLVVAILVGGPRSALAKSYSFTRVTIDATVLPDGSLKLLEHRTFDFHGSFTYAYFDIDSPFDRVEDFRILENGQRLVAVAPTEQDGKFHAIWTYSAQDEQRTFTIAYRVRCAVDVYADTAHLLWQFVGTGHTVPTDFVRITVHLPGKATDAAPRPSQMCPPLEKHTTPSTTPLRKGEVRAWGHGPFNGNVSIADPQTVVLTVDDLPPSTFVEGSIVFPPQAVPFAHQQPQAKLDSILAEERDLADEANALRNRHDRQRLTVFALYGVFPAFLVLVLVIAFWRGRARGIPRHLQEPPEEMHPVELAYLWSAYRGRFSPKDAYRAQLLHLAKIGAIEVTAVGRVSDPDDLQLRFKKEPENELDRDFVKFLFPTDELKPLSLEDLKATGTRRSRLLQWTKDATEKTKGVVTRVRKGKARIESHAVSLGAAGTAYYGYHGAHDLAGGIGTGLIPLAIVGWLAAGRIMPSRLGPKDRPRLAKWRSFRRFLKDFSSLPDAPALAVIIWEKYLVDAVALGVAKRVEKQVKELVAEEDLPSAWPGAPSSYIFTQHLYSTAVAHAVASSSTSSSWSSGWGSSSSGGGFGGGFSGGGGGGGGGTGSGAG